MVRGTWAYAMVLAAVTALPARTVCVHHLNGWWVGQPTHQSATRAGTVQSIEEFGQFAVFVHYTRPRTALVEATRINPV